MDDILDKKTGGYLETESDLNQNISNVKFQKEPEISVNGAGKSCGGNAWAKFDKIEGGATKSAKKSNPWLDHVKKVKADNPSLKYKDVLKKAKESYSSKQGGQIKTQHYYDSRIQDPVKDQKQQQADLKKEAKKPRGRPRKQQVEHQPKTSDFVNAIVKKEKGTKLKVVKAVDFDKNDKPVKLSFEKPKERKLELTQLDRLLGIDTDLLRKRKAEARKIPKDEPVVQQGVQIEEVVEGSGVLEDDILKLVMEKTQNLQTIAKKKAFTRKFIKDELKKRGLKPIIIKQILNFVLNKLDEVKGGEITDKGVSDASKAISDVARAIPKSSMAHLVDSLRESGVFSGTKKTIDTLVNKLDQVVNDPGEHRKRLIITRDIPNLKFKLAKKENIYNEKADRWLEFRRENARIEMNNIKAHIVALLNRVVGINMIESKSI